MTALDWDAFRSALADEPLPALLVDLDALDRNVDRVRLRAGPSGRRVRVATKSLRSETLLRRVLERGMPILSGLMCFSAHEAEFLAKKGLSDLLVAYPTARRDACDAIARASGSGAVVRIVVDDIDQLDALARSAEAHSTFIDVIVDIDVSLPLMGQHVGVRRSPLRSADAALELARRARDRGRLRVAGVMGYEAHVAGLPDTSPLIRAMKARAMDHVRALRGEVVARLRADGFALSLVNGGGTGSIEATSRDPSVDEITVGSGFLCSHLFDRYDGQDLEPAVFVALECVRVPDRDHITCAGGGYIASGSPAADRLPLPFAPAGLAYVGLEGAGEVQTPFAISKASRAPRIGDPVIVRPAKAGEIAERFREHVLIEKGRVVDRAPTYRGAGACFF